MPQEVSETLVGYIYPFIKAVYLLNAWEPRVDSHENSSSPATLQVLTSSSMPPGPSCCWQSWQCLGKSHGFDYPGQYDLATKNGGLWFMV